LAVVFDGKIFLCLASAAPSPVYLAECKNKDLRQSSFAIISSIIKNQPLPCGILGMSSFYCGIENYDTGKEWPELPRPSFFYVSVANSALPLIQILAAIP